MPLIFQHHVSYDLRVTDSFFLCGYNFSPEREFGVIKISPAACSRRIVRQWLAHFLGVGSSPFFCLNLGVVGRVLFFFHGFKRDLNDLDELFTLF